MLQLKANTAVDVLIGPFVDSTDGVTVEDGLTISQADVKLSKNGQALAQKNDATAAAHDSDGYYNCELDATDTNTEGQLVLIVNETGALPVRHEFNILSEAAYDSLYAAKDDGFMDVNIKTVGRTDTQETEANNLESACSNYSATRGLSGTALPAAAADAAGGLPISDGGGLDMDAILTDTAAMQPTVEANNTLLQRLYLSSNTAQGGTSTTIQLNSTEAYADDELIGCVAMIVDGTGAGQCRLITDYTGATDTATVYPAWTTNPSSDSVYTVVPGQVDAVAISGDTTAADNLEAACDGTGYNVGNGDIVAASVTGNVGGNVTGDVGGNVDGSVASVTAGVTLANGAVTDASLAGNMEIVFETDFATNYNTTRNAWATNAQDFVGTTAADPFNGQVVAASVTTKTGYSLAADGMDSVTLPADIITAASINTGAFTADAFAANALVAATFAASSLDGKGDWNTTTPPTAAAIADQVWEETLADHSGTAGSTAEALNAAGAAGDPWTTAIPGAYGAGSAGYILGNNVNAPIGTVDTVVDAIKAVTDNLPNSGALTDLATAAALTTVDTNVDAILVDTGTTLPATLTTIEGKIDTVDTNVDAILVDTGTTLPATLTTIEGKIDTVDTNVDSVLTDTGTTLPATLSTIDTNVDAILVDTGTTLPATLSSGVAVSSLTSAAITDVWSTDTLTEAYAADGAAGTPAQILYLIQQSLTEMAIASTTVTIKKLDGSTTAATLTLDDATTPTSKTRAT